MSHAGVAVGTLCIPMHPGPDSDFGTEGYIGSTSPGTTVTPSIWSHEEVQIERALTTPHGDQREVYGADLPPSVFSDISPLVAWTTLGDSSFLNCLVAGVQRLIPMEPTDPDIHATVDSSVQPDMILPVPDNFRVCDLVVHDTNVASDLVVHDTNDASDLVVHDTNVALRHTLGWDVASASPRRVHDTNVASALPCRVLGRDAQESNGTARGGEGDECVICLYEMMETEEVTDFIPCGHTYPSPHPSRFMAMATPFIGYGITLYGYGITPFIGYGSTLV
jgi:hypothetical protein